MIFFTLLAMLQLAIAARPFTFRKYLKNCDQKVEDIPWSITNFVMFEKTPASNHSSYFAFNFLDVNDRLEINTTCIRTLAHNMTFSDLDGDRTLCKDRDVGFWLEDNTLQISRFYKDICLGPPPYDSAIAYGRGKLNATRTSGVDGVYSTRSEMAIPISSLS